MNLRSAEANSTADGPLYRWDARFKLVGLFCLVFGFAAVRDLWLLPLMVLVALAVYQMSGMPYSFLLRRLKVPGVFLLAMAVVLPFFSGETVLAEVGPLALRLEGSLALLSITARFFSIITVATALFASTAMAKLVGAMRSLGIPSLLGDLLLFTYRYIFQLSDDLGRARTAARLRGARTDSVKSLKTNAYIVGSLLVRSHDQAERVLSAMVLRGYGNRETPVVSAAPRAADGLALAACIAVSAAFVVTQNWLL